MLFTLYLGKSITNNIIQVTYVELTCFWLKIWKRGWDSFGVSAGLPKVPAQPAALAGRFGANGLPQLPHPLLIAPPSTTWTSRDTVRTRCANHAHKRTVTRARADLQRLTLTHRRSLLLCCRAPHSDESGLSLPSVDRVASRQPLVLEERLPVYVLLINCDAPCVPTYI